MSITINITHDMNAHFIVLNDGIIDIYAIMYIDQTYDELHSMVRSIPKYSNMRFVISTETCMNLKDVSISEYKQYAKIEHIREETMLLFPYIHERKTNIRVPASTTEPAIDKTTGGTIIYEFCATKQCINCHYHVSEYILASVCSHCIIFDDIECDRVSSGYEVYYKIRIM